MRMRMSRMLKGKSVDAREAWATLPKIDKDISLEEAKTLYGDKLDLKFQETVEEIKTH